MFHYANYEVSRGYVNNHTLMNKVMNMNTEYAESYLNYEAIGVISTYVFLSLKETSMNS